MKSLSAGQSVETLTAYVSGKVQGVGFRAATVRQAHQLKLGGWVRNLADGRVQVLLQGDRDAVDRMLSWLLRGPPSARVAGVVHEEVTTERLFDRFEQL